jgi:hypothetical protein
VAERDELGGGGTPDAAGAEDEVVAHGCSWVIVVECEHCSHFKDAPAVPKNQEHCSHFL